MTNAPFLQGQEPLVASDQLAHDDSPEGAFTLSGGTMCYSAHEYMPRIRSALKMSELSSAAECSDQLARLRDHLDAAGGDGTAMHEGISLADYLMPLRQLAQPALGATWEQVLDIIDDLLDAQLGETDDDEPEEAAAASVAAAEPIPAAATMASQPAPQPAPSAPATLSIEQQEPHTMTTPATPAQPSTTVAAPAPAGAPASAPAVSESAEMQRLRLENQGLQHQVLTLTSRCETLEAWQHDRTESDLAAEAATTFDTYKDKLGFTEAHRPVLLSMLRADPTSFRTMYPPVAPSERHLLRTLAAAPRGAAPATPAGRSPAPRVQADLPNQGGEAVTMSVRELSRAIAKREGIDIGAAQVKAARMIRERSAQQRAH